MEDSEKELLATYRSEAASFFAVNQSGRAAVERSLALLFSVVAIAVAAAINTDTEEVLLPLSPLALLLFAWMCNQYSDLTTIGMARKHLEQRVNQVLEADALIYEIAVADVRKNPPLDRGVRTLQVLGGVLILALVIVGFAIAFDDQPVEVSVGYTVTTALSLLAACVSYLSMLATPSEASEQIAATLARLDAERRGSPPAGDS